MMTSNGNVPMGAQYDPNAPWNQKDIGKKEIEVNVTLVLSKTIKITVPDCKLSEKEILQYVKDLVCLPYEMELISTLPEVKIPQRIVEDFSGWEVNDMWIND